MMTISQPVIQAKFNFNHDLVCRLDAAIASLQGVAGAEIGLARLIEKRRLAASGEVMVIRQINEEACALIGRKIAAWTRNTQAFQARRRNGYQLPQAEGDD